jgi:hypothetical protein
MNIENLTIKEAREIASLFGVAQNQPKAHPFVIGSNYFIRTVTHSQTGKLVAVYDTEIVLENAAWIADSGRFQQALEKSEFSEVEMFPVNSRVIIGRGAIIDAAEIKSTPNSQK